MVFSSACVPDVVCIASVYQTNIGHMSTTSTDWFKSEYEKDKNFLYWQTNLVRATT